MTEFSTAPCDSCPNTVAVPQDWPLDWALCYRCGPFPSHPGNPQKVAEEFMAECGMLYPELFG